MNFLGHCFIAAWQRGTSPTLAPYVFGAMLPDFTGMARARVEAVDHRETADGVALHHETDRVFHGSAVFLDRMERMRAVLEAAGVRRGTSLAVGHVGSELLLDGWLLERDLAAEGEVGALYLRSLEAGVPLSDHLRFRRAEGADRMRSLLTRLRAYGLEGHTEVEALAERLERALQARPRLRIEPADRPAVRDALHRARATLDAEAPRWLDDLRAGLGLPPRLAGSRPKDE